MKKFILAALAPILYLIINLLYPLSPVRAIAEDPSYGTYAYIPTSSVYFYSDESDIGARTGLFRLPYSYYVRIVSVEDHYYRVEYLTDGSRTQKLTGYCKKDEVIPVDYIPEMPYLYLTVDVTYTISGGGKNDSSFSTITVTCAYYGDYTDGTKTYAYVLRDREFGYIVKPNGLTCPKNTEYDDRHQENAPVNATAKDSDGLSAAQITLLILLCLLIPAVAALIFRQPKKTPYDPDE